ncbi:MAG: hydrogenase maturation protease [Candidatus Bathyarchaeota archaeon]|nr:hydrogenase maturation protease [Candidatus Bathyarchaeota archaeon]
MADQTEQELQAWFVGAKKVVVAGIGNPNRSDDYVGLKIVEELQDKVRGDVCLLECETVPESFLLDIEEYYPTHVLLIDAAVLGHKAGDTCLVELDAVPAFSAVTSHVLPLRLFCEYIQKSTTAKIRLLLIEPKSMDFAEGLSPEVQATAKKLTKTLLSLLS